MLSGCQDTHTLSFSSNSNNSVSPSVSLTVNPSNITAAPGENVVITIQNTDSETAATGVTFSKSATLSALNIQGNCNTIPAGGECNLTLQVAPNAEAGIGQISLAGNNTNISVISVNVVIPLSISYISLGDENAQDFYTAAINGPKFGVVLVQSNAESGPYQFTFNTIGLSTQSNTHIVARGNNPIDPVYGTHLECATSSSTTYSINTIQSGESCIIVLSGSNLKFADLKTNSLTIAATSPTLAAVSQTLNLRDGGNLYVSANGLLNQWNGTSWSSVINQSNLISAVVTDSKGNVYIGTRAPSMPSQGKIMKWNGISWSTLYTSTADVTALCVDNNDNLYAGVGGSVLKWDGSTWTNLGTIGNIVTALAIDNVGTLYASGGDAFNQDRVMEWNGNNWTPLGSINVQFGSTISSLVIDNNSNLYAGGYYSSGLNPPNWMRVAKWTGSAWDSQNFNLPSLWIYGLVFDSSGNLYATNHNAVYKWNGNAWVSIVTQYVTGLTSDSIGNVYAGGSTKVSQWNGSTWSQIGSIPSSNSVTGLALGEYLQVQ